MKTKFLVLTFFVLSLTFVLCGAGCGNIAGGSASSYGGGNTTGGGGYTPNYPPVPPIQQDPILCANHDWAYEFISSPDSKGNSVHKAYCKLCGNSTIQDCRTSHTCDSCGRKQGGNSGNDGSYDSYDSSAPFIQINENISKIVIVANKEFENSDPLKKYISHKKSKNFEILEKYYPTGTVAEKIRVELKTIYEATTAENKTMCVLIVGRGTNVHRFSIPEFATKNTPKLEGVTRVGATDFYYGYYKDGKTDLFPQVAVGRLSASSINELSAQVDKIIAMETATPTNKNIVLAQHKNNAGQVYFSDEPREIKKYLDTKFPGTYTIEEAFTSDYGAINNAINKGPLLVSYSGHGRTDSWGDSKYNTNSVRELRNTFYPVVLGVTCNSANFTDGNECMAEAFMRNSQGGAVGYIGASAAMIAYYSKAATIGNDKVPGMVNSLICTTDRSAYKVETLGGLFFAALRSIKMSKTYYGNQEYKDYSIEVLNLFGDPTYKPYTGK